MKDKNTDPIPDDLPQILFAGTSRNDNLVGNSAANKMYGYGGDDTLSGLDGNDSIYGGAGNDLLYGGDGNDVLDGGLDNDTLYGDANVSGNDLLLGGEGNDLIYSYYGNDTLRGGFGEDTLYSISGNANMYGDEGNDLISGGYGNSTIYGGLGDDTIFASSGAGYAPIFGNEDNDILTSSPRNNHVDELTGGSGADIFNLTYFSGSYVAVNHYGDGDNGYALIWDFNSAEGDKVKLYGSWSDYTVAGRDDFFQSCYYKGDLVAVIGIGHKFNINSDAIFVS